MIWTRRLPSWINDRVQYSSYLQTPARSLHKGKTFLFACAVSAVVLLYITYSILYSVRVSKEERISPLQQERKRIVAEAFQHAWDGYAAHCFGRDSLHPVSNTCEDDFGGYGATAVDALTTAIMLRKEDVVVQILRFIQRVDFHHITGRPMILIFETNIRHLGAMLSAWDLLHGPFSDIATDPDLRQALLDQMRTLAEIFTCGFNTPSGVPHDWIEPSSCRADPGTQNSIAGVGTLILEFAKLSAITGDNKWVEMAERAENYLLNPAPSGIEPFPGLLGSYIKVENGNIADSKGSWGAFADSFYEYMLKAYIYDSNKYKFSLDRWLVAADSTIRWIGSHPYGHPEWTLLASWDGKNLEHKMESLSWFAGGNFILGGMVTNNRTLVDYGLSLADAAGHISQMTPTGLAGEFVEWTPDCDESDERSCDPANSVRIVDGKFRLRPEMLETWYHAYRATKDPKYREWSWTVFEAILRYCRTDTGFSSLKNVTAPDGGGQSDVQESFVFAEVMKYVYLTQAEDVDMPYHIQDSRTGVKNTWVYNTEAHPLQVLGPPV